MSIESKLGLFIVAFGLSSTCPRISGYHCMFSSRPGFFGSGVLPPLTAELAAVARGIEGVGYAHVYGAFNAAFGAGSTSKSDPYH